MSGRVLCQTSYLGSSQNYKKWCFPFQTLKDLRIEIFSYESTNVVCLANSDDNGDDGEDDDCTVILMVMNGDGECEDIPNLDVCLVLLSVCMNARPPQPPVEVIGPSPAMDKEFSSCDCHFYLRDIGGQQRDCWTPAGPWREAARCRR